MNFTNPQGSGGLDRGVPTLLPRKLAQGRFTLNNFKMSPKAITSGERSSLLLLCLRDRARERQGVGWQWGQRDKETRSRERDKRGIVAHYLHSVSPNGHPVCLARPGSPHRETQSRGL